jgi:hypothetical protein
MLMSSKSTNTNPDSLEPLVVGPHDRAAVVSKTVVLIFAEALRAWFRGDRTDFGATGAAIEAILRQEFAEIARQVRDETRLADD